MRSTCSIKLLKTLLGDFLSRGRSLHLSRQRNDAVSNELDVVDLFLRIFFLPFEFAHL